MSKWRVFNYDYIKYQSPLMETECAKMLNTGSGSSEQPISPDIQCILDTVTLSAKAGYLTRAVNVTYMYQSIIKTLTSLGFSVDDKLATISWINATEGEALKMRDLTYKSIKDSLYPMMRRAASQGLKKFMIPRAEWLLDTNELLFEGSDYFTKDGLHCITDTPVHHIIGFSWTYSTTGFGLELQQLANHGVLNQVLPYLKMVFERDGDDSRVIIDDRLTPYQLKYLAEKEQIFFENGEFFKKVSPK